jgi:hypothetical protein
MGPSQPEILKEILAPAAAQMTAKLAEIRAKFAQAGDKGSHVEELFRAFLREYVHRKLKVAHGEIIDSSGRRSTQTDLVIVNEYHPFTFTRDLPGLFFIEGVSAAGEVKTVLNSQHLESTIRAAQTFKNLRTTYSSGCMINSNKSDAERFYSCPPYFLVAFESELSLPSIVSKIKAANPNISEKPYRSIDAIFVLDRGRAINFGDGSGTFRGIDNAGHSAKGWHGGDSHTVLFDFLGWLSAVMPIVLWFRPIITSYLLPRNEPGAPRAVL